MVPWRSSTPPAPADQNRTVSLSTHAPSAFCDNSIVTSKYTLWNLVPKAIWEQFRRVSNFYFLIIAVVSTIPSVSPVSPVTTIAPLLVVVGFGLARDVYEDFGRKKLDYATNSRPICVVPTAANSSSAPPPTSRSNGSRLASTPSGLFDTDSVLVTPNRALVVGDIVRIHNNEVFPADLALLRSWGEEDVAYCSTANLDGESSLKRRVVPSPLVDVAASLSSPGQISSGSREFPIVDTVYCERLAQLDLRIDAPGPTPDLYEFPASLSLATGFGTEPDSDAAGDNGAGTQEQKNRMQVPLDEKNLLLRGSVLRNTRAVLGVVVYTGADTKIARNMRTPPSKLGQIERMMNRVVIALFFCLLVAVGIAATAGGVLQANRGPSMFYNGDFANLSGLTAGVRGLGTYIILFHTFIPVSLFVTLEFVRLIQGIFIFADLKMRTGKVPVTPKAGNLHEVLGNIEHILSDKTGTLTQNVMRFAGCSCGGVRYDARKSGVALKQAVKARTTGQKSPPYDLVLAMGLTHSVVAQQAETAPSSVQEVNRQDEGGNDGSLTAQGADDGGEADASAKNTLEYHGQSPDEVALVEAAREYGVELLDRRGGYIDVQQTLFGQDNARMKYKILAELEFSSERKRMSVVLEDTSNGDVVIYTKGADSVVLGLLVPADDTVVRNEHIHWFAQLGLRTLVYGKRVISKEEYSKWAEQWSGACNLLEGRGKKQAELAEYLETDLEFVGCTAVEDKLQDRVPETIEYFRKAGVKIWVLTGDKLETAENIGYSANLLAREMHVEILSATDADGLRKLLSNLNTAYQGSAMNARQVGHTPNASSHSSTVWQRVTMRSSQDLSSSKDGDLGIIVEGSVLALLDKEEELEKLFMDVSDHCKTVICARVTPSQKARMVQLTRKWRNSVTLAVGDGGNDVSMIQEAHIGVGIVGREGTQAALAADYSMGEFRHLERLLSVHGRYSYVRAAGVINLSLYKNILFSSTQILFQFFAFWTGTSVHNEWIITFYNALITLFGPFFYGVFEQDLKESTIERTPEVYLSNRNNRLFSFKTVVEHAGVYSLWHAAVAFFGAYFVLGRAGAIALPFGRDGGYYLTGYALSIMVVAIVQFKFFLYSHLINVFNITAYVLSFAFIFVLIPLIVALGNVELEGVQATLLLSPRFHLLWPLVFVLAFIPDFLVIIFRAGILPGAKREAPVGAIAAEQGLGEVFRLQRAETAEMARLERGRKGRVASSVSSSIEGRARSSRSSETAQRRRVSGDSIEPV